jgi:predicted O-linked N-acetylglucosamine transferase (SPINDLY family)
VQLLEGEGIAAERIEMYGRRSHREYLALYQGMDIALDTLPYNGHTTNLDSLWMGVPVVTLVGRTVVGRGGSSQLTNLGLGELGARSPDEYVRLATELAGDFERLAALRTGLRERMLRSPLTDAVGFTRSVEAAFREMWKTWCASPP